MTCQCGAYFYTVIQLGSLQVQRHEKLTKEVIPVNVGGKKGHNIQSKCNVLFITIN